MSNRTIEQDCLQKILESEEFSNSKTYRSYLSYLVEASASKKRLKETTIALEFFGKDANFDPSRDTIVRSHSYNLRKKLETYYLKEGRNDAYRLRIPKGHYEVKFVPNKKMNPDGDLKRIFRMSWQKKNYILLTVLLGLLLMASNLYFWQRSSHLAASLSGYQVTPVDDPIWQEYLSKDLPVLIVLGDHFFFNEDSDAYQNLLAIRDGRINSMEDLAQIQGNFPDKELRPAAEPYFPYHSIWSLPPILSLMFSAHQEPIIRKSSSLSPQMLGEYNIVFLGSIKTLYILKHTLTSSRFSYEISPHRVVYSPADSGEARQFSTQQHSEGPNDDLVLAVKLPGPSQNSIFIIASYHSLGAPEIANYLIKPQTRLALEAALMEKYGEVPQYFELLFRVNGIDKVAYETELLIYNKIDSPPYSFD